MNAAFARPLCALALLLCACDSYERVDSASGGAALMHNLQRAGMVEVQAAKGIVLETAMRAASLRVRERDGYALRISTGDTHLPRVWLGCYADSAARSQLERMGASTGLNSGRPWFAIGEIQFGSPDDALVACFEDPERPGLPLTFYYANDEEHLARLAAQELAAGWKPSLRAWSEGRETLSGPLSLSGRIDPARLARATLRRAENMPSMVELQKRADGLRGTAQQGCDPVRIEALCESMVRARAAVQAWAAPNVPPPELEFVAYLRAEEYTRIAGTAEPAELDPLARRIHACIGPLMPLSGGTPAARATARKLLGECALPWLEDGAAVDAAASWWGRPLEGWLAWICARGLALPLESIVDPRAEEEFSPHLLLPLRAALFRLVRETRGDAELRALWSGKKAFVADSALAQAFSKALAARAAAQPPANARPFPLPEGDGTETWRGVESEPAPGGEGWASEAGTRSIARAQELGANALGLRISLVARPDALALPDPLHPRRLGTREGDLHVFGGLAAARASSMASFVDVDLLATPSGIEDGAWLRVRPEQWERFFDARTRALVHAGLLAELGQAGALSIGCGLSAVTRDQIEGRQGRQEDLDEKRAGWAKVIAQTRRSFDGALVYVASPIDLQQALFWKDLDAVGFRLDEPLPAGMGNTTAERQELVRRLLVPLQQVAAVANAHKKPWFLARTGFEPLRASPGAPRDGAGSIDPLGIRIQLEALGSALLALQKHEHPAASFLWRWPADLDEDPLDPRDMLLGRPELFETLRKLWHVL